MNQSIQTAEFVHLWTQHARRIYAYLVTLVPNRADADDLLQETSAVLWQKFGQFEPGTDFFAWACQIAFFSVRNYRRRRSLPTVFVDDELLEVLSNEMIGSSDAIDAELRALADCFGKLRSRDQDLITRRYRPGTSVQSLSGEVGRSVEGLYKALKRIHESLFTCIRHRLAEGVE